MRKPKKRRKLRVARANIRKVTTLKADTGKLLLDVCKLVLGGIVISCLLRYELPLDLLLTIGVVVSTVTGIVGLVLGIRVIKKGNTRLPRRRVPHGKRSKR